MVDNREKAENNESKVFMLILSYFCKNKLTIDVFKINHVERFVNCRAKTTINCSHSVAIGQSVCGCRGLVG